MELFSVDTNQTVEVMELLKAPSSWGLVPPLDERSGERGGDGDNGHHIPGSAHTRGGPWYGDRGELRCLLYASKEVCGDSRNESCKIIREVGELGSPSTELAEGETVASER